MTVHQAEGPGADIRARRKRFSEQVADGLAGRAGADPADRMAGGGRTERFVWYESQEHLTLVVGEHEGSQADRALAIGLARREDRVLRLVLPDGWGEATLARWAWLDKALPLEVFTYGSSVRTAWTRARPPARLASLSALHQDTEERPLYLGDRTPWVEELARWACQEPDLDPAHRASYRGWQYGGQLILSIKRAGDGLEVRAGIHRGRANGGPPPEQISGPLSPEQLAEIQQKVDHGRHERDHDRTLAYYEHRLQAVLRRAPHKLYLEQPVLREVPAWRPANGQAGGLGRSRGFVDLAGLDHRGHLLLVETKLGQDDMLVLQGLDYEIWAQANIDRLAARFDFDADAQIEIVYCVGDKPGAPGVSRRLDDSRVAQLRALAPDLNWRLVRVSDWLTGDPTITPIASSTDNDHPLRPHQPDDQEEQARRRAARLTAVGEAHAAWAGKVAQHQLAEGTPRAAHDYADAAEHWADVSATPEEEARLHQMIREHAVDAQPAPPRSVVLARADRYTLSARWAPGMDLVFEGHDLNPPESLSDDGEYESFITVRAVDVPKLVRALGGSTKDDLLELLVRQHRVISGIATLDWLRQRGLEPEFFCYP